MEHHQQNILSAAIKPCAQCQGKRLPYKSAIHLLSAYFLGKILLYQDILAF
jgi:hypothetical protein